MAGGVEAIGGGIRRALGSPDRIFLVGSRIYWLRDRSAGSRALRAQAIGACAGSAIRTGDLGEVHSHGARAVYEARPADRPSRIRKGHRYAVELLAIDRRTAARSSAGCEK